VSGNVVHCGAKHDGDENAARNILVPGGDAEAKNGQVGKHKTTAKVAAACEMSTRRGTKAQYETQCLTAGEDIKNFPISLSVYQFLVVKVKVFCMTIAIVRL